MTSQGKGWVCSKLAHLTDRGKRTSERWLSDDLIKLFEEALSGPANIEMARKDTTMKGSTLLSSRLNGSAIHGTHQHAQWRRLHPGNRIVKRQSTSGVDEPCRATSRLHNAC
jgi:hypothetical protein